MSQHIHSTTAGNDDLNFEWLVGRSVTELSLIEPIPWLFKFEPDASIRVECLWRIIKSERIILTSEDHGHQFGLPAPVDALKEATELLVGRRVLAVDLRVDTADIVFKFDDGVRLEIIPMSADYESWQLHDPTGMSFVAHGGGRISRCTS